MELGGYLYAVGGMDSPRAGFWGTPLNTGIETHSLPTPTDLTLIPFFHSSVERYCPRTNKWTAAEPMHESRFGCAVVAHLGKIYVGGGFGQDKAILSSVECYDPDTDKVMHIAIFIFSLF